MRAALYYPHSEVRSEKFIRNALLIWDSLEYIAPFHGYLPHYKDYRIAEAMEIIGRPRVVTEEEQIRVHSMVEDMLEKGVSDIFRYSPADREIYELWPQKIAYSTYQLLGEHGLTAGALDNQDYPMSVATGLSLMSIIADVLAGETRARVTDRAQAYAAITNAAQSTEHDGHHDGDHNAVVALTLKIPSMEHVPIERLIEFRKKEEGPGGADYRALRHKYSATVEAHVKAISKEGLSREDRAELDRIFVDDMRDDFSDLRTELGYADKEFWFSKDIVTLVIAGVTFTGGILTGNFAVPGVVSGTGGIVSLGGLLSNSTRLAKARRETLRKHPMAYLYELQH
jgi:hypothetical protein